MAVEIGSRR